MQEGVITFDLSASGDAGESNIVSNEIIVRRPVQGLLIEISPKMTHAKSNVTIRVTAPEILGACLIVDHGDGSIPYGWKSSSSSSCEGKLPEIGVDWQSEFLPLDLSYLYEFPFPYFFDVTARLFAITGEDKKTETVIILPPLPCDKVLIEIQDAGTKESPLIITRSQKLRIPLNSVLENCSETVNIIIGLDFLIFYMKMKNKLYNFFE